MSIVTRRAFSMVQASGIGEVRSAREAAFAKGAASTAPMPATLVPSPSTGIL